MGKGSKIWKGLLAGGAGMAALAAVNSKVARARNRRNTVADGIAASDTQETLLSGEARLFPWSPAPIFYRVAGASEAPALILIHDISAGASHFMWRRNFDELSADFRVFALDLPGFGSSAKPPLAPYSADFYVDALAAFVGGVVKRPAHLVASSLGAAFAVRLADEHPELARDLILLSPPAASPLRHGTNGAAFYGLLHSPILGTSFYNAVASERSIRDHARKHLFYDKRFATDSLVANLYRLSHGHGAQHAISAFISGYLNADVREAFARLRQPVTVVWGAEDKLNPVTHARGFMRFNAQAQLVVFERARVWVQEERAADFNRLVRERLIGGERKLAATA